MTNKVPNIRFKGFTDDWEQRKLGEIAEFNPKSDLPDEFEYVDLESVVGTEMVFHRTENKASAPSRAQRVAKTGDVFFQTVRPYQRNNYLFSMPYENYVFSTGYAQMRPKINAAFLMCFLQTESFVQNVLDNCTGTSYPAINSSDLSNLKISLPILKSEQSKIGKLISNLDHLITLHQRKCEQTKELKRFMLQKMFPKKGEKNPEIRFPGFTDDWEQRKLGEIVERVTRKNQSLQSQLPLTISAQFGLIDQNEFFDKRIASKDVSGYYLIKNGEFAYNKSTSVDAPWGAIKRLDRYEMGVLSTLYIVFRIRDSIKTNSDYIVTYYDTNIWHKEVKAIAAEGARNHGLLNITPSDFFETVITLPKDFEEQQKIGEYFSNLDNLITLHQRKCKQLKELKKFMLQNMFPKKG
ncbi:restriction endonuclease subunit S [Streptococcus infantarius]|uniref:restriction endonuclease subunit S n=1 Tax=Streptococcus infantarius TaxID=102684 RepID=UPI0022E5FCDD|nr:restriction endonuclease subunit S [Streptococcus infantarius]